MDQTPATRRLDHRPPDFLIDTVTLRFELDRRTTQVASRLTIRRNPAGDPTAPLRLHGEALQFAGATLDGEPIDSQRLTVGPDGLMLADPPPSFTLDIATIVDPEGNTELSGLYLSGGNWFTQCEAEGFRRITYFLDRPDVMACYDVTLVADRGQAPALLGNGNPAESGTLPDGRHFARWVDPHPKPSYLFALVAGDLQPVRDRFVTRSGRDVALAIWVRDGDQDRCGHAMDSLKRSMRWDEETYGLEYDLDVFNIAAVSDFNMGAMENKGLNVFNTRYVLARPETATDDELQGVESVIAHEYFHNWTGNRITCRDWFQLSLKEGLTVFRDQQFSADMGSAAVKRIGDVRRLRAGQFTEDAGPFAHPVRPDSYQAIDNFYTATVYQKGAEIVRMLHDQLGAAGFRRGMDTYVARHDNQAVTLEDFVSALSDGGGRDLAPFMAWYYQAGTPTVSVAESFDAGRYTLTLSQQTRPTPGQPEKHPLPIPVAMALLDRDGRDVVQKDLLLTAARQDFIFDRLEGSPTPSLLRGFSAPVRLEGLSQAHLAHLAAHDADPVVRWDSFQEYATHIMLRLVSDHRAGRKLAGDGGLVAAVASALDGADADPAFTAECVALPSESALAQRLPAEDPDAVFAVRDFLRRDVAVRLRLQWQAVYAASAADPKRIDGPTMGKRALRNLSLGMLAQAGDVEPARAQFAASLNGGNMTDLLAAFSVLLQHGDGSARQAAVSAFHAKFRDDALVLDNWFSYQAASRRPDTLATVRALWVHPDFDLRNPNRCRSLVAAFASGNPWCFHVRDGAGYRFLGDAILAIDPGNGQLAARLVTPLANWRRHAADRAALQQAQLARLQDAGLSRFTAEKVGRALSV